MPSPAILHAVCASSRPWMCVTPGGACYCCSSGIGVTVRVLGCGQWSSCATAGLQQTHCVMPPTVMTMLTSMDENHSRCTSFALH